MHFVLVPPTPQVKVVAPVPAPKQAAVPTHAARKRPTPPVPASASSSPRDTTTAAEPAVAITPDAPSAAAANDPSPATTETGTPGAGANASDAAPHLDVKAARATARLIEKHRKDGLVAFPKPDPPLKRDDRLERAIERAHRSSDCKTAYSGLGLMALIPLAKDTLTGTGCRW